MKKIFTLVLVLMFASELLSQNVGEIPPDFSLKDLNEVDYVLSANKGKVILVFLVGYNCSFCIASARDVKPQIVDVFKTNDKFETVVIDVWNGSKAGVQGFKSTTGIDGKYLQNGSSVGSSWSSTYDRLFVVDKEGKLAFKGTKSAKTQISDAKAAVQTALNQVITSVPFLNDKFEFELTQNYPNPFVNETKIGFKLAEDSEVGLSIIDITGKIVAKPVNDFFEKGEHEITLSRNQLKNGMYFYRLEAGGSTATKRMIIN